MSKSLRFDFGNWPPLKNGWIQVGKRNLIRRLVVVKIQQIGAERW
jgi:hypothetical protein